jgi:hypothetical protein
MKRKRSRKNPVIVLTRKNGKRVKANASVKMSLKSLRRLVSAAKQGRAASVKVRAR